MAQNVAHKNARGQRRPGTVRCHYYLRRKLDTLRWGRIAYQVGVSRDHPRSKGVGSFLPPQLRRLLGYVWPYRFSMALGVVLLAVVAMAEGLIVLMIKPIFDRVLTPSAPDSNVVLFTVPGLHLSVFLNHFFPPSIHNVWTVVSI